VLCIAAAGALINYKLIALPMSEMVGAGDYLTATLRTSEVAALVIIFVEATMGLFLMETLRITHLFPGVHALSDVMRRRMMWVAFGLLVTLAGFEASLALMRDMLIADKAALLQSLSAVQQQQPTDGLLARIRPGADAARLHPALRAGVHRHPARVVHRLGAHGGRCGAGGHRARHGVRAAHCRQPGAGPRPRDDHAVRRGSSFCLF